MIDEATNLQTYHAYKMILPSSSQKYLQMHPKLHRSPDWNKSPILSSFFIFLIQNLHQIPSKSSGLGV